MPRTASSSSTCTGCDFIGGSAPTIADLSMSGYLFFPPEESGLDIAGRFPRIAGWAEWLKAIPGWIAPYEVLPGERLAPRW